MEWKEQIGKYFFFKLKSGGFYSGVIKSVDEKFDRKIEIIDKFGMQVGFNESDIIKYNEEAPKQMKNNSYLKPINSVVPRGTTKLNKSY